jgi:hypothetical protein
MHLQRDGSTDLYGDTRIGGDWDVTGTTTGSTKVSVGLSNVDNTTDLNKPISTLTQASLDLKADDSSVVKLATEGI